MQIFFHFCDKALTLENEQHKYILSKKREWVVQILTYETKTFLVL